MELDDLKKLIEERPISYSRNELESIFEIKTKRELNGINRKMRWDMIFMVITATVIIGVAFLLGLSDRFSLSVELILLVSVVSIHYRIKYFKINEINLSKYNLATGLTKSIKSLRFYIKLYRIFIPALATVFYGYQRWMLLKTKKDLPDQISEVLIESLLVMIVGVSVYFLTKWMSEKLYGKELRKMEEYLSKLN